VIRYLVDSSGLWRILRDKELRAAWQDVVTAGAVGSCLPQRVEFRRSARTLDGYEQMSEMFENLYSDVPPPKTAWRWIESVQYRLMRHGAHRALSAVDLLILCHSGLSQSGRAPRRPRLRDGGAVHSRPAGAGRNRHAGRVSTRRQNSWASKSMAGLAVLHMGKDFEFIAGITGQPAKRLAVG
jgi:hypothetical protein